MSIIEEIVQKRKQDIRNLSFNYGVDIPLERPRRVVPFLGSKGAILEIKRLPQARETLPQTLMPPTLQENTLRLVQAQFQFLQSRTILKVHSRI